MTNRFDDETQFWETPEWVPSGQVSRTRARDRSGSFERTRSHRMVARDDAPPTDTPVFEDVDPWVVPREDPGRAGSVTIDPVLLRIGAVGMVGALMIPIALALRDDSGDGMRAQDVAGVAEVATTVAPAVLGDPATSVVTIPATAVALAPATVAAPPPPAPAPAVAALAAPEPQCAGTYTVIANDFWNRFPRSSGASAQEWLNANGATADTPLYVGDELCIPVGATAPAPPPPTTTLPAVTTAAPTTAPPTQARATTPAPAAAPATAAATVATTPPTTRPAPAPSPVVTVPRPSGPTDPDSIEAIIREVWPDDLEERALTIAKRESGLRPYVHNWCCYGVFAIYFDMGRNFLPGLGITKVEQLFDARTNIIAAYHLYTLSGWKPWVQTDPG